ncbi:unnamed protein product [Effrenium voratum]|uniref:Phosphoglycerate mutase n=1 Tax=Effrenium voratum TaxID=2562239 RepID=A0AA36N1Z5_9DINO|nr:unnamed protein product [Effrenium voratum]CAJ1453087.1 unnamed protein product [Effrenium voratum]
MATLVLVRFMGLAWIRAADAFDIPRAPAKEGFRRVEVYLMRHGQSEGNVFPHQGPFGLVDPALTETGRSQATQTGLNCLSQHRTPDLVLASCLLRAQETALLAFGNSSVYVAPFISEDHWGQSFLHPGSTPGPADQQRQRIEEDLGPEDLDRLVPAEEGQDLGPPSWSFFLEWLPTSAAMQRLQQEPLIAVVSHGNFLQDTMAEFGWDDGHPKNAEVFRARMDLTENGFGPLTVEEVLCPGYAGDKDARNAWIAVFASAIIICILVCVLVWWCRRAKRGLQSASYETSLQSVSSDE